MRRNFGYILLGTTLFGIIGILLLSAVSVCAQRSGSAQSEAFTFIDIADTRQGTPGSLEALRKMVQDATGMSSRPAFVIDNGSITESGSLEEYARFKEAIAPLDAAGIRFYAIPGNHDIRWSSTGKQSFEKEFGKLYQSFDYGGTHFILLDSTVYLEHWGHFDKSELDWLTRDLKRIKPETPLFLFMHHYIGRNTPSTRMIDNEFDLEPILRGHNVVAIFTGYGQEDLMWQTNGVNTFMPRGLYQGSYYKISVTPDQVSVDRYTKEKPGQTISVATIPISRKSKPSIMRAAWDDPDIPFLERRRPAATLQPRAVTDNPEKESADYRMDDSAYKPMKKDARDVWRDQFPTKDLSIGIHTVDIRLTSSNNVTYQDELIFEVERDSSEPTRKWAVNLDGPVQSSPLLDRQTLYVSSLDGHLYAFNTAKGKRRWAFPTKGQFLASPVLAGGLLYIGSTDHYLYAVDADTGRQRWKYDTGGAIFSTVGIAQGVVCLGSNGKIVGLDAENGTFKWTLPAGGLFQSRVAADSDTFYMGGWDNMFYAINAKTGAPRWKVKLGKTFYYSPAIASPALGNGHVYVCSNDGILHALNVKNGNDDWTMHAPQGSDAFGYSSPLVIGQTLYLGGLGDHGDVYALNTANGAIRWQTPTGQAIYDSSPKIAPDGKSFAIMGVRGNVSVISVDAGKKLWSYQLGPGNIFSTPEYDGNIVYTTTMGNDVQAINGPLTAQSLVDKTTSDKNASSKNRSEKSN